MSGLSEFLADLPSDELEALKVLSQRGMTFYGKGDPSQVDEKVALVMGDTILDLGIALGVANESTRKKVNGFAPSTTRLGQICYNMDQLIEMRSVEEEANGVRHLAENLIASAQRAYGRGSFGYAFLDKGEKDEVHGRLDSIRKIISASNLNDRKKNAIFERLNALAKEVDIGGTPTDRFFSFMGDLAFVVGEMTTNAKPAIDETKEILRIVTRARARAEGIELPKPQDWSLLPPPKGKSGGEPSSDEGRS